MPRAISAPSRSSTLTVSPRAKRPLTAVTPAGSRLLPERSACRAPASMVMAPLRTQRAGYPLLARVLRIRRRQEPAAVGALLEPPHRMQRRARGDGHGAAGGGRDLRRGDLGGHAARAHGRRRAAAHGLDLGRDVADLGNEPRRRIEVRIRGVQAGHVRQQQQAIRARHLRDARRQPVVVAVADLGGGHRVVFVDDGQRTEFEQLATSVARALR